MEGIKVAKPGPTIFGKGSSSPWSLPQVGLSKLVNFLFVLYERGSFVGWRIDYGKGLTIGAYLKGGSLVSQT